MPSNEQLRRDIGNEVRAEIYKSLLELDSARLLKSQRQLETLERLSDEVNEPSSEDEAE
ncbi:MAG: hypothetical protein OXG60_09780 [Chloroflexi bacterium]|nr:hypothetical protein [Chloroflexota bacterium]